MKFIRYGKYYFAIGKSFIFMKGATMYELQLWRFGITWCHLNSKNGNKYFGHPLNPIKRLEFKYYDPKIYGQ